MNMKHRFSRALLALLLTLATLLSACVAPPSGTPDVTPEQTTAVTTVGTAEETTAPDLSDDTTDPLTGDTTAVTDPAGFDLSSVPAFSGSPYAIVNNNLPFFTSGEITTTAYEHYGALDALGRCTVTMACLGKELMPTKDRGSISSIKPTGWHSVTYACVNGDSLYNRCHLIGWQLSGEDANRENLVTGTRYMNESGMLPFENMLADYIKETGNHVMYRVTPIFTGNDLVCRGVLMEAYSVEDDGEGISFNVFCYNVQPGVIIDYLTGESQAESDETAPEVPAGATYIINKKSKKFHRLDSKYYGALTSNMEYTTLSREELIAMGYSPCGTCKP